MHLHAEFNFTGSILESRIVTTLFVRSFPSILPHCLGLRVDVSR
jgi:hypothetical protein